MLDLSIHSLAGMIFRASGRCNVCQQQLFETGQFLTAMSLQDSDMAQRVMRSQGGEMIDHRIMKADPGCTASGDRGQ